MSQSVHDPLIQKLIDALMVLPSVGNKSATRMAYYLLERNRLAAQQLATVFDKQR